MFPVLIPDNCGKIQSIMELHTFRNLVTQLLDDIQKGKIFIQTAQSAAKTLAYWTIGSHIHEYLQYQNNDDDTVTLSLIQQLNNELPIGQRSLYLAYQFYRKYPQQSEMMKLLTWSHFKLLLTVSDDTTRKRYESMIIKNRLSIRQFIDILQKDKLRNDDNSDTILNRVIGKPYHYRLVQKQGRLLLDLGFHVYHQPLGFKPEQSKPGSIYKVTEYITKYGIKPASVPRDSIYTYRAYLKSVTDGDTITFHVDIGFGLLHSQKIRLKDINAAEMDEKDGPKAKLFVTQSLRDATCIVIKTYHRDRYARFLADVFFSTDHESIEDTIKHGQFLNQLLLDSGLASRYYQY
jgi:endonuclease YncB( thermonuclease family)